MSEPNETLENRHILIVEDEYFLAIELELILRDIGVTVMGPVPSVKAALALIDATPAIDAAVLDINLGGETVYPVADRLAAEAVPFLFATGYGRPDIPERFARVARVGKPFEPLDITRALGQLLRAARRVDRA